MNGWEHAGISGTRPSHGYDLLAALAGRAQARERMTVEYFILNSESGRVVCKERCYNDCKCKLWNIRTAK